MANDRKGKQKGLSICETCGASYMNYCLNCEKLNQPERVHELLTRFKLDEENLVRYLANMVKDGSFPALNLAITLRDMKPAQRSEVNLEAGKSANEARDRLNNLFAKLSARRRENEDDQ